MSAPLIDPSDLALYLQDPQIDEDRALALIADSQTALESVVSPLNACAAYIVKRVAGRAYVTSPTTRGLSLAAAGGQFTGGQGSVGGVYLTKFDVADVLRCMSGSSSGSGGAFAIDPMPADAGTSLDPWNYNVTWIDGVPTVDEIDGL